MCPSLCVNRGPMVHLDYYHYHQLILFNAAHNIITLLPVIFNMTEQALKPLGGTSCKAEIRPVT